ncbi:nuclease-related domain-containing protein [Psychrobacillus antarcticus]|uniref:nuclease-related domain-containing protein n=1 Tax=Psychrobacillus antarcticus TaxID=2879115 RepID=UPI002407A07C|nr:nuclease-related domain-containing protein [Psychrobacillus antarcticus]
MIVKPFKRTLEAEALNSLATRLPISHPMHRKMQKKAKNKAGGDIGEEVVMRELEKLKLPYPFHAYHNISLYAEKLIQMDILIVTPHYALILEVKNFKDTVEITSNPSQMVQTLANGTINVCRSPESQVEDYIYQLTYFFKQFNINLPVLGAVVFAFETLHIINSSNRATILLKNDLLPYLRAIKTQKPHLTETQLERIKNLILQKSKDYKPFPLSENFLIEPNDLITGVICEKCTYIGIKKVKRTWVCPKCNSTSQTAHQQTIKEYFLIARKTLSNRECRQFLRLNNNHEATRIMKKANLTKVGKSSSTKYQMIFPK